MDNERYFIDLMPNPWDKYYLQPFFYIISLMECAEEYKGEILSERIKKCIDKYMKNVMLPLTKRSPFGHVGDFQKKNPSLFRLTYKSSSGSYGLNAYISCASFIFSKAACLLNKPEYLDIAERQVQWIAGRNPKGCSMVAGMGYKRAGVFTHMSAIPSHRDAQVTGGVISGFLGGNGTKTGRDGGHPIDFPVINISSSGYASVEPGSAEAWQINTGWFLLAVSNLHDAKEKFEKMKKEK
jgi:hypothetical protein